MAEQIDIDYSELTGPDKLTEWENEPSVKDLKKDLESAKQSHDDHVSNVDSWLDNLNVTGSVKLAPKKNRSSVVPKVIRKQAEWRYSSLSEPFLSTDDIFNTRPATYEDVEAARQAGLILNHQFNNQIRKVAFIDEYVRTAVDEGSVIIRTGWDYEEEEVEVDRPVYVDMPVADPMRAQQMADQGIPPMEQQIVRYETVTEVRAVKNQPTAEICDYNDVIVDPTCKGDIDKAGFIVFRFETSKSELEKDGRYINLEYINIDANSPLLEPDNAMDPNNSFKFHDKPRKRFIAYEYWGFWDINKTGITEPIVATWVGDTLIRMEENPFPDKKLPFVIVPFLPVRKSVYGQPDGELLEDNQKIIGAVTRGMIDIMGRSANGQTGIRKGALDPVNRRKFEKGHDYEFNSNMDARNAFHMHKFEEIPRSAEYMLNQQNADAESLTGVKAFNSGITGNSLGSTVGGADRVLTAAAKRELGILRRLAEGIKEVGRKFMAMNLEFLSEEEVVRITEDKFERIRRDNIQGNYDIVLDISTAEADNQQAEELAFMLQTMGNNMDPAMSQMILANIARLRKMPRLAKQIEEYQPQPDPLAQRKAELEVAFLEAQVNNENAKAQENAVDVGYKLAKTDTERAKSRDIHSNADKKDLDYLAEDMGINHQQELEKRSFDRNTQLDLKAADKLLNPSGNNKTKPKE